jgi:hypothetical protein
MRGTLRFTSVSINMSDSMQKINFRNTNIAGLRRFLTMTLA